MIRQRFYIDGDPADVKAYHCRDCGASFSHGDILHSDRCEGMLCSATVQELRLTVFKQRQELEQKDRELNALHIWGAPDDESVRA